MADPLVTADLLVNKNLFAAPGQSVKVLRNDFKTTRATIVPGGFIGRIYSYLVRPDGNIYWMVYLNDNDYKNQIASYVKHEDGKLKVPEYPGIIEQLKKEMEEKEKEDKGLFQYYIEKYAPYLIGAVVVAVAAPTIFNAVRQRPAVSGKSNGLILAGLIIGGVYLASKSQDPEPIPKQQASILIEHI